MKNLKLILFFFVLSNLNAQDFTQFEKKTFEFEIAFKSCLEICFMFY